MRKQNTLSSSFSSLFLFSIAATGCQQQTTEWADYGSNPMEHPDFLTDFEAARAPGEAHAELMKGVGTWNTEGALYVGPDAKPIPTRGVSKVESLLGGRVLLERYRGEYEGEDADFEGVLLMGYDNLAENYWSVWADSMTTWPTPSAGGTDEDGNLRMTTEFRDIMTPAGRPGRLHIDYNGDGSHTQRFYDVTPDGKEFLMMVLTYRRP